MVVAQLASPAPNVTAPVRSICWSACSVAKNVVKISHSTKAATVISAMAAPILPKCRGMGTRRIRWQSGDTNQVGRRDQSARPRPQEWTTLLLGVKETPMANSEGGDSTGESAGRVATDGVILVVCPTHRDHRELPHVSPRGVEYFFHDYASTNLEDLICNVASDADFAAGPLEEMDAILAKIAGVRLVAVISTDDYPGSALAAAIAKELGLPGPDRAVTLICQHKYLARRAQKKLLPDAVPLFALIDVDEATPLPDGLRFPLFVKPVKSFFSIGAERVDEPEALAALLPRWAAQDQFFAPLDEMLQRYAGATIGTKRLIAEGVLKGEQESIEVLEWGTRDTGTRGVG